MANEFKIMVIQECSKLASSLVRSAILKPRTRSTTQETITTTKPPDVIQPATKEKPAESSPSINPTMLMAMNASRPADKGQLFKPETVANDEDYRWECLCKHLGSAAVLLREAHERAVTDKAVTEGVAEKVMAALNEHAGADDDLKPMLSNPKAERGRRAYDGWIKTTEAGGMGLSYNHGRWYR